MRGRYLALFSLAWALPATFGPATAGIILDNYNPNLVWYLGGFLCAFAVAGFLGLHVVTRDRFTQFEDAAAPGD